MKTDARYKLQCVWHAMRNRCNKPSNKGYPRYGGRGIHVCPPWQTSFETFLAWALSNGWAPGLCLDRADNGGSYYPENCRFVSPSDSGKNRDRTPKRVVGWSTWYGASVKARIKPVICIETGETFASSAEAGRKLGLKGNAIANVCAGLARTHQGLHFKLLKQ